MFPTLTALSSNVPRPEDDGVASHLLGLGHAAIYSEEIDCSKVEGTIVVFAYPMTEELGKPPELGVDHPAFTLAALHDRYENEKDKLVAAHKGRFRISAGREACFRTKTPQPQKTVIQFWPRMGIRDVENNTHKEGVK